MKAAVIAGPRRLALIGAASLLVPLSLVVLAYGAIERRVSLQEQAKEMTPERGVQRIQVAGEPRPSAQTAVPQQPPSTVWPVTARRCPPDRATRSIAQLFVSLVFAE